MANRLWWNVLLIVAAFVATARATTLTGVIIYEGNESGPVPGGLIWHTSLDPAAAPVGVALSLPPRSFARLFINDAADGEIDFPLFNGAPPYYQPAKNLFTLFWQSSVIRPLPVVTVNIFFNDDKVNPGISAVVPVWPGPGFTYFRRNTATSLLSLYLREVDNNSDLVYADGDNKVTLTALMVAHAGELGLIDRVGLRALRKDGFKDTVAILELTVAPVAPPNPLPTMGTGQPGAPSLVNPLQAIVGPAEPGTLPEDHAATPGEIAEPTELSGAWTPAAETPGPTENELEAERAGTTTPVAAGTAETSPGYTTTPASTGQGAYPAKTPTPPATEHGASATPPRLTEGEGRQEAAMTPTPARSPGPPHKTPTPRPRRSG